MLEQCRKSGLSAEEAEVLLVPVRAASEESLPAEIVFTKIEEGLAKKVPLDQLVPAAELRLNNLRRASRLVAGLASGSEGHGAGGHGGGGHGGGGHGDGGHGDGHSGMQRLVGRTAMALESGLPEPVLQAVFNQTSSPRYGRIILVVEAGESLQLAGLEPLETKQIMMDCLDRNLNRMEIQRAVDYIIGEHRKGRSFEAIRGELWVQP